MFVRALRITVLKSAGNFTRDECHDLNAEKIQRVKCFMFTRCGICCVPAIFERRRGRLGSKISGYGQLAEVAVYFAMPGLPPDVAKLLLSLLPVVASAARVHKRPTPRWHGYGFLLGYQQPPNNSLPAYARNASASRMARRNERPWYIDPVPSYYGYDGDWHYFGRPGFYGGRYNGGSLGPCWTRTPIGPIWNCG